MIRPHRGRTQRDAGIGPARERWRSFWAAFSIIAALAGLWALASPLASVPDEPAHVVRAAAVARGEFAAGPSAEVPWEMDALVPAYYASTQQMACFAFTQAVTPSCAYPRPSDPTELVHGRTSAGPNNPAYYLLVGWPSLIVDSDAGFYAMRMANVLLCAALGGFVFMGVGQLRRARWGALAAIVAVTPMVLFLAGAVNPNGVEILATGAVLVTLLTLLRTPSPGRLLWERGAILLGSTALLVTTRSIAMLWLLLVIVAAAILADRTVVQGLIRRPAAWVALGLCAAACIFEVWWFTRPLELSDGPTFDGTGNSFRVGFETMFDRTFQYLTEWVGLFGWVDRLAPGVASAISLTAFAILVLGAMALGRRRWRLTTILAAAAVLVLPPLLQAAVVHDMGYIWQGRYSIALILCLLLVAGLCLDDRFPADPAPTTSRLIQWGLWLLAFGHGATFVWILRRYVVGDRTWLEMITAPSWQPPGGWILLTALFTGTLIASVLYIRRRLIPAGQHDRHASRSRESRRAREVTRWAATAEAQRHG